MRKALSFSKIAIAASVGKAKTGAKIGEISPQNTRTIPDKLMNVAKGTINMLANTVTGEKIIK